jgi:hypothetical protein
MTLSSVLSQGEQPLYRVLTLFLFILITSIMPHKMGIMQQRRVFDPGVGHWCTQTSEL